MDEKKQTADARTKEGDEMSSEADKLYAAQLTYDNSYQLEPEVLFNADKVDSCISKLLEAELKELLYDSETIKDVSLQIAKNTLTQVKALNYPRYKLVCVVQMGDIKSNPSMISSSRSLWNKATDNYSVCHYSNNTLYAILMLFAVYTE